MASPKKSSEHQFDHFIEGKDGEAQIDAQDPADRSQQTFQCVLPVLMDLIEGE